MEFVGYALFELFVFLEIALNDVDQVVGEWQTSDNDGRIDGLGKLLEGPNGVVLSARRQGWGG